MAGTDSTNVAMFSRPLKCDRNVKRAMIAIDMFADTASRAIAFRKVSISTGAK
jgi:hypothetical protein